MGAILTIFELIVRILYAIGIGKSVGSLFFLCPLTLSLGTTNIV